MPDKPYVTRPQNIEALRAPDKPELLREWLSAPEVSALLNVPLRTVQHWCQTGAIKAKRPGRRAWRIHYSVVSKRHPAKKVKDLREKRAHEYENSQNPEDAGTG